MKKATLHTRRFMPPASPPTRDCKGVFGVVGMPYCGSTIVSYVLGAHSKIYAGADLYKLSPNYDAGCSICGEECTVWTRQAKDDVYLALKQGRSQYYNKICCVTNKDFICDASKTPAFFLDNTVNCETPFCYIQLIKHPIRHLTSFLYNHYFVKTLKINGAAQIDAYKSLHFNEVISFIESRIEKMQQHIDAVEVLKTKVAAKYWLEIRYEDFVLEQQETLTKILDLFSISKEENQFKFHDADLHPIVGNNGPLRKVKNARGNGTITDKSVNLRASFYDSNKSNIQLDEKYKIIFTDDELMLITNLEAFQKLCNRLGYDPHANPEPKVVIQ